MKRPKKYDLLTLLNLFYPVGRGFLDFTNTDYSNYLGFKWERELVNLTPIGCDETGSNIGETKGSETHIHYTVFGANPNNLWGISNHDENFPVKLRATSGYDLVLATGTVREKHPAISEFATYEESSYQPSKVVAYWKRVA